MSQDKDQAEQLVELLTQLLEKGRAQVVAVFLVVLLLCGWGITLEIRTQGLQTTVCKLPPRYLLDQIARHEKILEQQGKLFEQFRDELRKR